MPRWLWWMPLTGLVLLGAVMAFRLGWIAVHLTETAAIEAYAERYQRAVGQTGVPDCVAWPGSGVWLVIRCGQGEAAREYHVNRFGGLLREGRPRPASSGQGPRT